MAEQAFTEKQDKRRREILRATLRLLRNHGTGITTAQIAADAHCSKETLYAWFGDRDGIFQALVEQQSRGMNAALGRQLRRAQGGDLRERLIRSGAALLDILTGDAAITVNRLAMAEACRERAGLGIATLDDWQTQVVTPFLELFDEGVAQDQLTIDDPQEVFEVFMGLLLGDRQRRLLLGEDARPHADAMEMIAQEAVERWLMIFSAR